jgi:hypothetical protein
MATPFDYLPRQWLLRESLMQQRQLRLGDILDDYCPRERRVTNHAIVAMVGTDVKQTRCTTCDAEHEYKRAIVPRQRRKLETPAALSAQTAAGPKRVAHEPLGSEAPRPVESGEASASSHAAAHEPDEASGAEAEHAAAGIDVEEGPVHRPLIRATLPRPAGQPPPVRPAPEFTIRQPGSRQGRFRPRHHRGSSTLHGNRSGNFVGSGPMRQGGSHAPLPQGPKRHGPGHKRSK